MKFDSTSIWFSLSPFVVVLFVLLSENGKSGGRSRGNHARELAVPTVPLSQDFESFYARELRKVIGLAFVLSGSPSGAEDLAQEAFLKAYKRWDTVGTYDNPGGWVRRVVANTAVSKRRRRTAEAKALVRIGGSEFVVPEMSPDAMVTWAAVRRLPRRQAQAIALRYYDQSSIAEIAQILDCTTNTVKTHLQLEWCQRLDHGRQEGLRIPPSIALETHAVQGLLSGPDRRHFRACGCFLVDSDTF